MRRVMQRLRQRQESAQRWREQSGPGRSQEAGAIVLWTLSRAFVQEYSLRPREHAHLLKRGIWRPLSLRPSGARAVWRSILEEQPRG